MNRAFLLILVIMLGLIVWGSVSARGNSDVQGAIGFIILNNGLAVLFTYRFARDAFTISRGCAPMWNLACRPENDSHRASDAKKMHLFLLISIPFVCLIVIPSFPVTHTLIYSSFWTSNRSWDWYVIAAFMFDAVGVAAGLIFFTLVLGVFYGLKVLSHEFIIRLEERSADLCRPSACHILVPEDYFDSAGVYTLREATVSSSRSIVARPAAPIQSTPSRSGVSVEDVVVKTSPSDGTDDGVVVETPDSSLPSVVEIIAVLGAMQSLCNQISRTYVVPVVALFLIAVIAVGTALLSVFGLIILDASLYVWLFVAPVLIYMILHPVMCFNGVFTANLQRLSWAKYSDTERMLLQTHFASHPLVFTLLGMTFTTGGVIKLVISTIAPLVASPVVTWLKTRVS